MWNSTVKDPPAERSLCCGVPQGSILGPLFFLLYVNDSHQLSQLEQILFSNDTNLFISNEDPLYLNDILNVELKKLSDWFGANKISLNVTKTKFMVFTPWQKKKPCYDFRVLIGKKEITRVSETLFLGVLLDECLPWKFHISQVAHKISKPIGIN